MLRQALSCKCLVPPIALPSSGVFCQCGHAGRKKQAGALLLLSTFKFTCGLTLKFDFFGFVVCFVVVF